MRTSRYTILTGALLSVLAATEVAAQPVLTQEDFLSIGDRARMEIYNGPVDVTGLTAPGPTGDWGFTASFGEPAVSFEIECLPADEGPVDAARHVPGADRVVENSVFDGRGPVFSGFVIWDYQSCDPNGRTWHGSASRDLRHDPEPFRRVPSHPVVEFPLPLTLGDEWTEAYRESYPLNEDALTDIQVVSSVDAWGTATLPGIGTVDCLRVNQEIKERWFDESPPAGPAPRTETRYSRIYTWLARGVGVVASISKSAKDSVPDPGFTGARWLNLFVDFTPASVAGEFVRGEANGDGSFNIADAIQALKYLFSGGSFGCEAAADVDDSGRIGLNDAVYSLNYLFRSGPAPAAPFPSCGPDPTTDLPCESFTACP